MNSFLPFVHLVQFMSPTFQTPVISKPGYIFDCCFCDSSSRSDHTLNLLNKGHSFQRTSLKFQRFFCCPLFLSLRYRKNLTSCPLFFKNYILPLVVRLIFFNKNQILKIIHFAFSSKVDFFIKNRHNS